MQRLSLALASGHLVVTMGEHRWLLDTGSPVSFGQATTLELDGQRFTVAEEYMGLDAAGLSALVGEPLSGLLGTDILSRLDIELDLGAGWLGVSLQPLELRGVETALDEFMGLPILLIESDDGEHRMFFDTGAQISYFQHNGLGRFRSAGELRDFFPGLGEFHTDTHIVPFRMGPLAFEFRCGRLPELLGLTLAIAGVDGIVGNEICVGRKIGYFARRRLLVLA